MKFYIVRVKDDKGLKKAFPTRKQAEDYFNWYKDKFAHDHIEHTDLELLVERKITWFDEEDRGYTFEMSLYQCSFKKVNKENICFLVNSDVLFALN